MAFGKKKKKGKKGQQQPVYQPSGVKVDKTNNPFYPPKKESDAKELGITAAVVVVCLLLVSVIVKNFNYYAIQQRQQQKAYQESYNQQNEVDDTYIFIFFITPLYITLRGEKFYYYINYRLTSKLSTTF